MPADDHARTTLAKAGGWTVQPRRSPPANGAEAEARTPPAGGAEAEARTPPAGGAEAEASVDVVAFWGKAGAAKADRETVPHPLICHAVDTAAVAALLFDVLVGPPCRAELAEAFVSLGDPARWVAFLCGLHDVGKVSPAFQALRADVAARSLSGALAEDVAFVHANKVPKLRTDTPHGALTAVHFERVLVSWGATAQTARVIATVLGGHHGIFDPAENIAEARDAINHHGGPRWAAQVDRVIGVLGGLLDLPDPSSRRWSEVSVTPGAAVALAGLITVSDWVASHSVGVLDHAGTGLDLGSYVGLSRARAAELVAKLGWERWLPPADTGYRSLFGGEEPRPVQRLVAELAEGATGPGIMVVEAPTGEGKTRAALQAAATLVRRLGLAGFCLAMPTRATSNQAYGEVCALVGARWPVKLLHSTAAEYLAGAIVAESVGMDGPNGGQEDEAREWFTRKKGLLASLAVGTVDRLLQAAIRARSVAVPLLGMTNKVIVIDEVHAYDAYMSTLLDRLLWWLGRLGVPVILLSATLPAGRREDLVRHWCAGARRCRPADVAPAETAASEYPRVTWADADNYLVRGSAVSELNRDRRVRVAHIAEDVLVGRLLGFARDGQNVAMIHNVVRRAEATHAALEVEIARLPPEDRPELILITGPPTQARTRKEARLTELFGRHGRRPARAIVVGTQILETGLDLDFDVMVSDVSPIDSLIQRAGRLHRFRKVTHPPLLGITGVTDAAPGPKIANGIRKIYQDRILLRTWALLRDRSLLRLPDDVSGLVEAVYGTEDAVTCPPTWAKRLQRAAATRARALRDDAWQARSLYLPPPPRTESDATFLRELTMHAKNPAQTRKPDGRKRQS